MKRRLPLTNTATAVRARFRDRRTGVITGTGLVAHEETALLLVVIINKKTNLARLTATSNWFSYRNWTKISILATRRCRSVSISMHRTWRMRFRNREMPLKSKCRASSLTWMRRMDRRTVFSRRRILFLTTWRKLLTRRKTWSRRSVRRSKKHTTPWRKSPRRKSKSTSSRKRRSRRTFWSKKLRRTLTSCARRNQIFKTSYRWRS